MQILHAIRRREAARFGTYIYIYIEIHAPKFREKMYLDIFCELLSTIFLENFGHDFSRGGGGGPGETSGETPVEPAARTDGWVGRPPSTVKQGNGLRVLLISL